jgi:hypothetical protein
VLTGSSAAYFEEYAQARLAMLYTDEPDRLAERLDLRPVETGANVLVVRPRGEVVYERAQERDGVRVAAPSQIAVDLLSGPGREPAEARPCSIGWSAMSRLGKAKPGQRFSMRRRNSSTQSWSSGRRRCPCRRPAQGD